VTRSGKPTAAVPAAAHTCGPRRTTVAELSKQGVRSILGFVSADGIRFWLDPMKCSHSNESVCEFCDFDGYYEATYPACPWRTEEDK